MKFKKVLIFILVAIVFIGGAYSYKMNKIENLPIDEKLVKLKDERFNLFKDKYPDKKVLLVDEGDISNDGKKDLLIVYKNGDFNEMVAVVKTENKLFITKPTKAPKENLKLKFKNIDNKDQVEVVLSGSKNGNVGYAIFRLEGEKLTDLFGEGMDKCC